MQLFKFLPGWAGLALVLTVVSLSACATLMRDSEQECSPQGGCRLAYLSKSVSGRERTPDQTIGVFAMASVSGRGHGSLQLTFYKLGDNAQQYRVRDVSFITARTMTEGRPIQFEATGVSGTVRGEFDYSAYFPAISIDVKFGSATEAYSCRVRLAFSRTYSFADSVHGEPQTPHTVAEFLALGPPTPDPIEQSDENKKMDGCKRVAPFATGTQEPAGRTP